MPKRRNSKQDFWAEERCLRCGQCCCDEQGNPCKYLKKVGNLTECTIYEKRLGVETGEGRVCILRKDDLFDYPGCPYNTGKPFKQIKAKIGRLCQLTDKKKQWK